MGSTAATSVLKDEKKDLLGSYNTFAHQGSKNINPEAKASFFSKVLLGWVYPLLKTGRKQQLNPQDVWDLTDETKCGPCSQLLMSEWDGKSSLLGAVHRTYGLRYYSLGILLAGAYACDFFGPVVLHNIVANIKKTEVDMMSIFQWLACLFASRILKSILFAQFFFQAQVISLKLTSAMKGFVYQKALRLNAKSRVKKNTGDVVNIYTTDVSNIINAAFYFHYLWVLPIQIIAALYMLYGLLGSATFAGLATIVLALLMNHVNATLQAKYFQQIMKVKDERMKVVNEMYRSMQIIKLNAWENKMIEKLMIVRNDELRIIWKYMRTAGINIFLLWGVPVFVSTATFAVYALVMHQELTASKVFTALALFRLLQEPLRQLPSQISGVIQANVSLKRVMEFAQLEERVETSIILRDHPEAKRFEGDNETIIALENASFTWDEAGDPLFSGINLKIKRGDLVVVHGRVGSGKSSFCSALLGEMVKTSGVVYVGGETAYCSQQAWIQNLTIRDNILFGQPFDAKKFAKVVDACGLKKDFELFPGGDKTEIGEKGLNVSGGQKARLSLARACYSDADIFVLDSPLAAVDSIVQNEIFNKCILGLLRHKTVILVTHNPEIIASKYVDQTVDLLGGQFKSQNKPRSEKGPPQVSPLPPRKPGAVKVGVTVPPLHSKKINSMRVPPAIASVNGGVSEGFSPLQKRASSFIEAQTGSFIGDKSGNLVAEEERKEGRVSSHVFTAYFKAIGGFQILLFLVLVQVVWQVLQISSDFWLTQWTSEDPFEQEANVVRNMAIYSALAIGGAIMVFVRTMTISYTGLCAASRMFNLMTKSLMIAPMSFFDANPVGRLLNRYSDDVSNVDFRLPFSIGSFLAVFFSSGATLLVAACIARFIGILIIPLLYVYVRIGAYYLSTARELQRLQKVTQSPVLAHVSESVDGASVIRAFGPAQVTRFVVQNETVIDRNNANQFASFAVTEWFAMRMQMMGGVILLVITLSLALLRDYLSAGVVGLAFNYGLMVDQGLESLIMMWSSLETTMVSPERIQEYIDVPSEAPHVIPETEPALTWPQKGEVTFENVSFRYKVDGKWILKDLTFKLRPKEKVGIVGRTGAGKSSLTMALFRINELAAGKVIIDDVDIAQLGLNTLRGRLSIITQAPVLFKGTIRGYLDPFNEYGDEALWNSLRKVELFKTISSTELKLEAPLEENGENFSVGERQMLCMARALLSTSKVVVMDEATASIDHDTDTILQKVIRMEFANSTVITIAHRLDTVLDSDRIMVLDAGQIVEFDSPKALIAKGKGHFFDLAREGGYLDRMKL